MPESPREITNRVALVDPDGHLNRDAVGWSRHPLHDTSGIKGGLRGIGRNKRWEYWLVMTPELLVSLTLSDIDYAAVHTVWGYQIDTRRRIDHTAVVPLALGTRMPASLGEGVTRGATKTLNGRITELEAGTRIEAEAGELSFDVLAGRLGSGESLGVVVPWSDSRFQYTVKDPLRPAAGWIGFDGLRHELAPGQSWAVLDHGRGRWPYKMWWNWAAGVGTATDGRAVGLQFGGRWTDGTGAHENAIVIDGRLYPIHEDVAWRYNSYDWLAPWRLTSKSLDLELQPFWDHASTTDLKVLSTAAHQVFGHWHGSVRTGGERIEVDGVLGFAEDVRNRW